ESVLPCKRFPVGNERDRLRTEVCPNQSGFRLYRVGLELYFVFESSLLCGDCGDVLIRLFEAMPGPVKKPAVIVASQTALLREAVRQIRATVSALPVNEAEGSAEVFIED